MIELGELESHVKEFKNRKTPVEIVAISTDKREDAQKTQTQFPHVKVVADTDRKMCQTLHVMHGEDKAAPTTILVDGQGTIRWLFRADRFLERLSPAQVLAAIDKHLPDQGTSAAPVQRAPFLACELKGHPSSPKWEIKAHDLKKLTVQLAAFSKGKVDKETETSFQWREWERPAADVIGTIDLTIDPPPTELAKVVHYSVNFNFDRAPAHDRTGDKDIRLKVEWLAGAGVSQSTTFQIRELNEARALHYKLGMLPSPGSVFDAQKEVPVVTAERVRGWTATGGRQAMLMALEIE